MKTALRRACAFIDRLNAAGAAVAALCCAVLAVMLIAEVVFTSGFEWSQPWAVEYAAYLCAMTLFAGSGYAVRQASHIRIRVLIAYLPEGLSRAVDFACTLAALAVAAILAYGLAELAWRSWERGSVSYFVMQTPLAVPQGLLALAALLLCLALLARALRFVLDEPLEQPAGTGTPGRHE